MLHNIRLSRRNAFVTNILQFRTIRITATTASLILLSVTKSNALYPLYPLYPISLFKILLNYVFSWLLIFLFLKANDPVFQLQDLCYKNKWQQPFYWEVKEVQERSSIHVYSKVIYTWKSSKYKCNEFIYF